MVLFVCYCGIGRVCKSWVLNIAMNIAFISTMILYKHDKYNINIKLHKNTQNIKDY